MSYLALYRKFRPAAFEDVRGQEHIVTTLRNQLKKDRIGHAYLFCGTRGTGKTSVARLFAKSVNCDHPADGNPCGRCQSCRNIEAGVSMNIIEIDAASNNSVENIRDIVEGVRYSPTEGRYKVYIIDEVHMLSTSAFNALLKTLEEPPAYVIFILATTEVHKIPITILSRCQRYDFRRITVESITKLLSELMIRENIATEEKALAFIAKAADGSMRDALSLLDQCISFFIGQRLTYENVLDVLGKSDVEVFAALLRYIIKGSVTECMQLVEDIVIQGRELSQFVDDFTWYLRNLLIAKMSDNPVEVLEFSKDKTELLIHEAHSVEEEVLIRYIRISSELSGQMRYSAQKRLLVETSLIKLCRPESERDYSSLIDRIRKLEERLEEGWSVPSAATPPTEETRQEVIQEFPKALSEDLQAIAKNWKAIIAKAQPVLRMTLISVVPTATNDNRLLLVFNNEFDKKTVEEEGRIEELVRVIETVTGKTVDIETKMPDNREDRAKNYIDITKLVNMKIEYSD